LFNRVNGAAKFGGIMQCGIVNNLGHPKVVLPRMGADDRLQPCLDLELTDFVYDDEAQ
jgi:hypothetical protein